jgi:putative phosphoesterase
VVVAIISDTHLPRGSRRLPERCVGSLRAADLILHAGDFTTAEVVKEIQSFGPFAAVHGNVDSEEVRRLLPEVRTVDADGVRIAMLHDAGPASGRLERMRALFPDADAVVFGHSHVPLLEERDGFHIFNPGSPTDKRRQPHRTMGIGEVDGGRIRFRLVALD